MCWRNGAYSFLVYFVLSDLFAGGIQERTSFRHHPTSEQGPAFIGSDSLGEVRTQLARESGKLLNRGLRNRYAERINPVIADLYRALDRTGKVTFNNKVTGRILDRSINREFSNLALKNVPKNLIGGYLKGFIRSQRFSFSRGFDYKRGFIAPGYKSDKFSLSAVPGFGFLGDKFTAKFNYGKMRLALRRNEVRFNLVDKEKLWGL